jgi:hypothetical protein
MPIVPDVPSRLPQGCSPLDADEQGVRAIADMTDPLACCPGCLADAGQPWPEAATSRHCPRCLDRIHRVYQVSHWNRDHAHQVQAGHASWEAFSARWRVSGGLPPRSAEACRRYVTAAMIRGRCGLILPEPVRLALYRAWCDGLLIAVGDWLAADDPPPDPNGLWAAAAAVETAPPAASGGPLPCPFVEENDDGPTGRQTMTAGDVGRIESPTGTQHHQEVRLSKTRSRRSHV